MDTQVEFADGVDDRVELSTLTLGEQFLVEFDFGDSWLHLCTVGPTRIDPTAALGIVPTQPLPYWGWGTIPDQYGRRWDGDDGEHDEPPNPGTSDLRRCTHGGAHSNGVKPSRLCALRIQPITVMPQSSASRRTSSNPAPA